MTVKISHNYSFVSGNITHTTGNTNAATTRMISENSFKVLTPIFFFLIYFGCVGSLFLCEGFLQLRRAGATLHCGARASHCRGLSCCGAQAPDAQAQQLWLTGPVAPRHVGSSQTRARTRVPCIGRRTLNRCTTREALTPIFIAILYLHQSSLQPSYTIFSSILFYVVY